MSHRVTVQTEIKDKAMAIQALQQGKYTFEEAGSTLRIKSGTLANVTIDLASGQVSGDTDFRGHTKDNLGLLRQMYAEAKFRHEVLKTGGTIDERSVNRDGDIEILHTMMA